MTAELTRIERGGLQLIGVTSAEFSLVFAPDLGGRLLSARCGGTELLWHNGHLLDEDLAPRAPPDRWPDGRGGMGSWANVGGSKTWPAPQGWSGPGEWAGPPDPVLDAGAYQVQDSAIADGGVLLTLTSAADARSGLRVERRFTVPGAGRTFSQRNTFTNIADRPVRWSIWEVCQVGTTDPGTEQGAGGGVTVPVGDPVPGGSTAVLDMGCWFGTARVEQQEGAVHLPVQPTVAKWGFPTATGSVSYRGADGSGLELSTRPDPAAAYPDGGSRVEVWMQCPTPETLTALGGLHPDAHLVELEVLGPWTALAPGESTSLELTWTLHPAGEVS